MGFPHNPSLGKSPAVGDHGFAKSIDRLSALRSCRLHWLQHCLGCAAMCTVSPCPGGGSRRAGTWCGPPSAPGTRYLHSTQRQALGTLVCRHNLCRLNAATGGRRSACSCLIRCATYSIRLHKGRVFQLRAPEYFSIRFRGWASASGVLHRLARYMAARKAETVLPPLNMLQLQNRHRCAAC
jgi:hypothetical protein